jgi:hypothetical protein
MRAMRVPSEATPGKRDIVFDLTSDNPKVARSNRAPATTGAARPNLKAPFLPTAAESAMFQLTAANCFLHGDRTLRSASSEMWVYTLVVVLILECPKTF